jgi:hypothetical protein
MRRLTWLLLWFVLLLLGCIASAQNTVVPKSVSCNDNGILCTEVYNSVGYEGKYTGHDEPSVLFYSNVPGSGNSSIYKLVLPKDPPTLPKQDGTGGTFNFQLHPAFWFGMAMCDDQSSPNPGGSSISPNIPCTPDSDSNIFDGSDPTKPNYIGKHPGTAFMEMQFYPPGWVLWPPGNSCDATHYCAAMFLISFSSNDNTGQFNNPVCENTVGDEFGNFAFLTKTGVPHAPPSPLLATLDTFTPNPNTDLFMSAGDRLVVTLHDTPNGFQVVINDLTTGQTGSMTASATNGFGAVLFDPNGTNCNPSTHNLPTNFHPIYATSSEHTRVPWAAHSYNIAFSDEIGHFEYCNAVDSNGNCTQDGVHDLDSGLGGAEDDFGCFNATASSSVPIGGCLSTDFDFDGVPYQLVWPGTFKNANRDKSVHPEPVRFTSPLFVDSEGEKRNYRRVAFEADLPRIEFATNPPCQRHVSNPADPNPGKDCVNPPVGANFYPFFTTTGGDEGENCMWQLGGANIRGTINSFGGNSNAEFGSILPLAYPASNGRAQVIYEDFRRVLSSNPCRAGEE